MYVLQEQTKLELSLITVIKVGKKLNSSWEKESVSRGEHLINKATKGWSI